MSLALAIRDAGVNRFTDPETLVAAYGEYEFPVTLGCVPFQGHTRTPALPESRWDGDPETRYPLGENDALVDHVRAGIESGAYAVACYGHDAVRTPAGPEFCRPAGLGRKLEEAVEYLEELFGDVSVFVPPDGRFCRAGLEAVKAAGLDTLYHPGVRHRPRDAETARLLLRDVLFKYRHRQNGTLDFVQDLYRYLGMEDRSVPLAVRPFPYHVDGGWEFTDLAVLPSNVDRLRRQLRVAAELNGAVCLSVEHWRFAEDAYRAAFEDLLATARERYDVRFVDCAGLFP